MGKLRKPIAYLCALLLSWMSVVAGVTPVTAQPFADSVSAVQQLSGSAGHHPAVPAAMSSMHAGHHASPAGGAGPSLKPGHRDHQRACIEVCLSRIAAKLLPSLTVAEKPRPLAIKIDWTRQAHIGLEVDLIRPTYWPTGPPGQFYRLGSGTARLVALNARMRN